MRATNVPRVKIERGTAALSQEDVHPQPKAKHMPVETRTANAKLDALKKKTANTCAAAALVPADDECTNGARLIALGCRVVIDEFMVLAGLSGVESTQRISHVCSQWGW